MKRPLPKNLPDTLPALRRLSLLLRNTDLLINGLPVSKWINLVIVKHKRNTPSKRWTLK